MLFAPHLRSITWTAAFLVGLASVASAAARGTIRGLGNTETLETVYERWRLRSPEPGSPLVIGLGWSKAWSDEFTNARGRLILDPDERELRVEVRDLPRGVSTVWLVENRPGSSVSPEPGDRWVHAGELEPHNGAHLLTKTFSDGELDGFRIDLVVVGRRGETPDRGGVLFGAPTLFQKLARPALYPSVSRSDLGALVELGEDLFFNEGFDGNGRTCGSCHPAENSFMLDPDFIATLPPTDPLFVAEFDPNLQENFESPVLMREFALILENVDGFDDLENKFTMRGVPHTLAMGLSIGPAEFDSSGGGEVPPFERTGWSGDGAPGNGTLREFAIGAIRQHFPKTLARAEGPDFRFPTDLELDAIEAFSLALGREAELDVAEIELTDPVDKLGRELFNGAAKGKCFECHVNAGANANFLDPVGTQNVNFDTGVEGVPHPADGTGALRPRDGGFGLTPNPLGGFGDGRFNTPSLVEAADTPPFFHNNAFATIEEAVDFYNSDEFNASPAGRFVDGISLSDTEVRKIAAFLRTLNALENIRSAADLSTRSLGTPDPSGRLDVASAEIGDAIEVLSAINHHQLAVGVLEIARALTEAAAGTEHPGERDLLIDQAIATLDEARELIQTTGSSGPDVGAPGSEALARGSLRVSPNPGFGPRRFEFPVISAGEVKLELFDVRGRLVDVPFRGALPSGPATIDWERTVARGVLFARLETPDGVLTARVVTLAP